MVPLYPGLPNPADVDRDDDRPPPAYGGDPGLPYPDRTWNVDGGLPYPHGPGSGGVENVPYPNRISGTPGVLPYPDHHPQHHLDYSGGVGGPSHLPYPDLPGGGLPYPPSTAETPYPAPPAGYRFSGFPGSDALGRPTTTSTFEAEDPAGKGIAPTTTAADNDTTAARHVEVNRGPASKLLNKAVEKGMRAAGGALSMMPGMIPSGFGGQPVVNSVAGGYGEVKRFANQDYESIRQSCRSRRILFEDPEFPASNRLLVDDSNQFIISYFGRYRLDGSNVEWLRPKEICQRLGLREGPKMIVGESDRFDINQGEIGDCWFLAAVANLAENDKCFRRVVPPDQDFDDRNYAGVFRFRFWRFGEWVEIVVDDRLPTRNGQLIYLRSVEKNEFWGALLEKAYAKLHGSYKSLEGGLTIEAAVDFTGGIPELIHLGDTKMSVERIFYIMSKADASGAFMGAALGESRIREAQSLGLQSRHAYTITKVVEIRSGKVRGGIPLVRLRNPHGNDKEWRGDWSDEDRNWKMIPKDMRNRLGLTFEDDGEFYMSFRDFLKFFGELEICHLTPDSFTTGSGGEKVSRQFEVFHFHGQWVAGKTAGGCGNSGQDSFATNPQFFINLSDPDPYDDETHCPVIVAVSQKSPKRKTEHAIGFKVYRCRLEDRHLDASFFRSNQSVDRVDTFINLREVSKRTSLREGRYCIIPCTFNRNEEAEFLVRVFVEKRWGSSESARGQDAGASSGGGSRVDGITGGLRNINIGMPTPGRSGKGPEAGKGHVGMVSGILGNRKKAKVAGFALKQLERNFPKGVRRLREFYNWATDRDSEFALLTQIIKSL